MTLEYYQSHIESLSESNIALKKKYKQISNYRLLLIVVGFYLLIKCFQFHIFLGLAFLVTYILCFYYLVKYHETKEQEINQITNEKLLIENEMQVLQKKTNAAYFNGETFIDPTHHYSSDLDIFGNNSLFEFINRCKTQQGIDMLAEQLSNIEENLESLNNRQEAVKELSKKSDWRLGFQAALFNLTTQQKDISASISSLTAPPPLKLQSLIFVYSKMIPFIWIAALAYIYYIDIDAATYILGALFLINMWLGNLNNKLLEPYLRDMSVTKIALDGYRNAANYIANETFESEILKKALVSFPVSELKSKNPIDDFAIIVQRLDTRKNDLASITLTFFKPYLPLEIINISRWLSKHPTFFKDVFSTIGVFEYYASIATLSFNNPKWVFPTYNTNEDTLLDLKQAGHPLIRTHEVVCNDFKLNESNHLNLITGSNMSGKSTFLRTIGLNIVLGNTGGPVSAKAFTSSVGLKPVCYMRISDSISENASTFKAEINRIKLVLDAIRLKEKHLFLIDEMLRGTNSEDKLNGSLALLEKFVSSKALALVATHDLRVTEISEKYPTKVKNYYFEYATNNGNLEFDYLIKEGICSSFNASQLLESIGLDMGNNS